MFLIRAPWLSFFLSLLLSPLIISPSLHPSNQFQTTLSCVLGPPPESLLVVVVVSSLVVKVASQIPSSPPPPPTRVSFLFFYHKSNQLTPSPHIILHNRIGNNFPLPLLPSPFPFVQYEALRRVHLIPAGDEAVEVGADINVNVFRNLDSPVSEGGENFSIG